MPTTLEQWHAHQRELYSSMGELMGCTNDSPSLICPYPLLISESTAGDLQHMGGLLLKGLNFIVANYLSRPDINEYMPLPPRALEILHLCNDLPYRLGMARPDFLFGPSGEVKVCEINARFPANGMMLSQELARASAGMSYRKGAESQPPPSVLTIASQQLSRFDTNLPLILVNGEEKGNESLFLLSQYEKFGGESIIASPGDLRYSNGCLRVDGRKASQFILEITRSELMSLDSNVISCLTLDCNYFNDMRTQILVHDKRVLAVLADRSIMAECLGPIDAAFLTEFLLPGFGLHQSEDFDRVRNNKDQWVIKGNSSGRGVGLHIGVCTPATQWQEVLDSERNWYMAQQYLAPLQFELTSPDPATHLLAPRQMTAVASLPCFDSSVFGPGFARLDTSQMIAGSGEFLLATEIAPGSNPPVKLYSPD